VDLVRKYEAHQLAERVAAHAEAVAERTAAHNGKVAADSRAHQAQVAQDARDDAAARRITDLYGKAVDQLGSEKALVRLGGLSALECLAR
jgi:2-oxoglutarate dehydrogenase complex dehydrogenase (E1) component-like enzyme